MKIIERFKKTIKLTNEQWDQLNIDINEKSIKYICETYGLKKSYVKAYKDYLNEY